MLQELLRSNNEFEITKYLIDHYEDQQELSEAEVVALLKYEKEDEIEDASLIGIIGLIIGNKARIWFGRLSFDVKIKKWCDIVDISKKEIEELAASYMDDDYTSTDYFGPPEVVLRSIALSYPKQN